MEDADCTPLCEKKVFDESLNTDSETRTRWIIVRIVFNRVLIPSIRLILEQNVFKEYKNYLKTIPRINVHSTDLMVGNHAANDESSDVNNENGQLNSDEKITSHVEYAKLFLEESMKKNFHAFDETCDASVVLHLFTKMNCFHAALQNAAKIVEKGRNILAHYKPSEWLVEDFKQRFHDMKKLVVELGLSPPNERQMLEVLDSYEREDFCYSSPEVFLPILKNEPKNFVTIFQNACNLTKKVVQCYTQKLISIDTESPNIAGQKVISGLLDCTSEIKAVFAETLHSLDLFESYLKHPGEKTYLPLKHLFDRGKCSDAQTLTTDEINAFVEAAHSLLTTHSLSDEEHEKLQDCYLDSHKPGNKTVDLYLNSQPNSISPPLSSSHESNLKITNLKNKNLIGNGRPTNVAHSNPENAVKKCKDDLTQASLELDSETKVKSLAWLEIDSDDQQYSKNKKGKKPESKISKDVNVSQIDKVRKDKEIHKHIVYSDAEKKMKYENLLEHNTLKARTTPSFPTLPALRITFKIKELEDENLSLKQEVEALKLKYREILGELGQITFEQTAKENEERESEHFRQIYHTSLHEGNGSGTSTPVLNTSIVNQASSRENPLVGAGALVQENNQQSNNEASDGNDGNESGMQGRNHESTSVSTVNGNRDHQTATTQNTLSVQPEGMASGGGGNQSGQLGQTHDQASPPIHDGLSYSVQQAYPERESISLSDVPPASVATSLYNNYKFLLLFLAQKLLSSDVVFLQDWAAQKFSINNPRNATDILLQLDQKKVINASDLRQLSDFFESINRWDLVHIIDAFLLGDYNLLRQNQVSNTHAQNHGNRAILRNTGFSNAPSTRQFSMNMGRNRPTSRIPVNNDAQNSLSLRFSDRNSSNTANTSTFGRSLGSQSTTSADQHLNKPTPAFNSVRMTEVTVADSPVTNERRTTLGNAGTRSTPFAPNGAGKTATGSSNGSKHSKFQRPESVQSNSSNWDADADGNWLCNHYKRHCYVKFDCCDKFWPCHRCHNNQSTCGRKKLKSRDTRMLQCRYCDKVQQFGENCCNCGAKFANYYCGSCKHLTGIDDHPYHCEKCGICRIHGDRSFHCDICGVCLDVQLRGNHKCRAGSAHDECCICLEDAFTGCQILPCSHKVHKECATQMIRSGITRCPICRESFAHKLQRTKRH